jgi:ferredoxin
MERILNKEKLFEFLERIKNKGKLIAPKEEDGVVLFKEIENLKEINLSYKNSLKPASEFLFPQNEILFKFSKDKEKIELTEVTLKENFIIFGMHPCDVHSIKIFDNVFTGERIDKYYQQRKENTLIISLGCQEPEKTCFCTSFGIEPAFSEEADISMVEINDKYYLKSFTEKGENLIKENLNLFEEVKEDTIAILENKKKEIREKVRKLEIDGIPEKLKNLYDSPLWQKIAFRCIGCGICTYLCPTCYCFDIRDEEIKKEGCRFRCWDSCQFAEFTLHASGHNPRPTKKERQRQRYFHKLNYYPERYKEIACVGCGRCVRECPVNIDIREIITEVGR